jgi:hypothetical protein
VYVYLCTTRETYREPLATQRLFVNELVSVRSNLLRLIRSTGLLLTYRLRLPLTCATFHAHLPRASVSNLLHLFEMPIRAHLVTNNSCSFGQMSTKCQFVLIWSLTFDATSHPFFQSLDHRALQFLWVRNIFEMQAHLVTNSWPPTLQSLVCREPRSLNCCTFTKCSRRTRT